MNDVWIILIFIIFVLPYAGYVTMKFGTYGFLKAKFLFSQHHKGEPNGNSTKRETKAKDRISKEASCGKGEGICQHNNQNP